MILSSKTMLVYNRILLELKTKFDAPDLKYLKDTEAVISYIEGLDKSFASRKLYYACLVSVLRDLKIGRTKLLRQAEEIYRCKMVEYNTKLSEIAQQQTMTPREVGLWLEWEEVLEAHQKLKSEAEANLADKKIWLEYVVLSLYVLLPPLRSDWSPVRVSESEDAQPDNKLVVSPEEIVFVLQAYKTSKQYGIQRIVIPTGLNAILRHWLTLETSGFLFSLRGLPCSESWLSGKVRSTLKRMTGKSAGINILRHSYISFRRRGEAPLLQQNSLASSMMHSVGMSQMYRRL